MPATKATRQETSTPRNDAKWGGVGLTREEVHEGKRQALVAVANQVFRKQGYHKTSMDDVANHLNVSKTAIYYYVKNKQELLFLCYELAFKYGAEAQAYAELHGKTGREKLEMLIRHYTVSLVDRLGGGALMSEDSALSKEHRDIVQQYRHDWNTVFRRFVEEAIADGDLRPCNPRLTEFFVMGAIRNIHHWYSITGELTGEQIADELVEFVFNGVGA
jgi:TetR/AcrR family transcriptional regulator